jgi:type I restriction enzyme S subunit
MINWREYRLSDLMDVIGGGTPKTSVSDYWGGDIPWLSVVDFGNDFKRVFDTEKKITKKGLENSSTKLLKKGQLIISARGTVGELAILGRNMAFNQSCYGLNAKFGICTNDFLYYLMKCKISELKRNAHGAVFDTITRETFDTVSVSVPDLPTQTAIAEILSSLDDKIELNNKINQELENLAQTLFKRWFIDFEFPNENGEPYKSSGGEMVESELGEIPKGWEVGNLNQIAQLVKKNIKPFENPDKLYFHYSLPEFDSGKLPSSDLGATILSSKYQVLEHSILVSKLNPRIPRVWTVISPKPNSICSTEFQVLKPINQLYFPFVNYLCKSVNYLSAIKSKVTGTSGSHQRVNPLDLINYELVLPDINIVERFNNLTYNSLMQIDDNISENQVLTNVRDTLLPKLISGELEVQQVLSQTT